MLVIVGQRFLKGEAVGLYCVFKTSLVFSINVISSTGLVVYIYLYYFYFNIGMQWTNIQTFCWLFKSQAHGRESLGSSLSIISISDSDSATVINMETETIRSADTADGRTGPIKVTNLSNKIFDEVYEQYQKGYMTENIDKLRTKMALAIPEEESTIMPATTVSNVNVTGTAGQSDTLRAKQQPIWQLNVQLP